MGQTLENGVYLPSEGERNCYAGLKTNWEILDQKVAEVTALQQAVAGALHREIVESLPTTDINPNTIYMILSGTSATENVYNEYMYVNNAWELIGTSATDLTNYYTKAEVDGKLLLKANDSDVVHKTGDETSTGFKEFANIRATNSIKAIYLENTTTDLNNCYSDFAPYAENKGGNIQYYYCNTDAGTANISNLPEAKAFFLTSITTRLISNSLYVKQVLINSNNKTFTRYCNNSTWSSWVNETDSEYVHKSGNETVGGVKTFSDNISTKKIISNVAQLQINARSNADSIAIIAGDNATEGGGIWLYGKNSVNNSYVALQVYDTNNSTFHAVRLNMDGSLTPTVSNNGLGSSSYKWVSFNGLNPSSLGMPDLDNGIDISSYITVVANGNKESLYTPPANGWISVALTRAGGVSMAVMLKQGNFASSGHNIAQENGTTTCNAMLPVKGGVQVSINSALADGIDFAYFYPCLGNV